MTPNVAQALSNLNTRAPEFVVVYANQKPYACAGKATVLTERVSFAQANASKNKLAAEDPYDLHVYGVQHVPTGQRIGRWRRAHGKHLQRFHTREATICLSLSDTLALSEGDWAELALSTLERQLKDPRARHELKKKLHLTR
ncbi:hypothetical protein ACINK0_15145 [Deinococcus sp. VB343]|uniref:hypothetical protein n=1 Tax=Deinococcus sp. VB343 TaxID=3385567 RepID=UPI0039C8EE9F